MVVLKTSDHIPIKIKMLNHSQESPAFSKAPNEDLKDMDVLCNFKIKKESQNLDHGYIKDQWPYSNQYKDAKHQSGPCSVVQSPKSVLKGHGCSLPLQNKDSEPKFGFCVYQRPVTIFKSRLRCTNPSQELSAPTKAPNQDLQDIDVLRIFKIKIDSQNLK